MDQAIPTEPGSYRDDHDPHGRERYFDGTEWTKRLRCPAHSSFSEKLRLAKRRDELPDWYARPAFVVLYLAIVLGSFLVDWRAGLLILAYLPAQYIYWKYLWWLPPN
jgi:uncharacterized protein DUF2510